MREKEIFLAFHIQHKTCLGDLWTILQRYTCRIVFLYGQNMTMEKLFSSEHTCNRLIHTVQYFALHKTLQSQCDLGVHLRRQCIAALTGPSCLAVFQFCSDVIYKLSGLPHFNDGQGNRITHRAADVESCVGCGMTGRTSVYIHTVYYSPTGGGEVWCRRRNSRMLPA